jgi:hypothetical protein
MRLSFTTTGNLLYATGESGSFTPGAPEPAKPVPANTETSSGRLPSSPPPNPKPGE